MVDSRRVFMLLYSDETYERRVHKADVTIMHPHPVLRKLTSAHTHPFYSVYTSSPTSMFFLLTHRDILELRAYIWSTHTLSNSEVQN